MSDLALLAIALLAGSILGTIFFGGLWWTVQKSMSSAQPALWVFPSLLLRTAIALTGFYFVSRGDWRRLLACLAGFIAARLAVTWLTRLPVTRGAPCA
jgi:F1F0 ATPase subunit 2